MSGVRPPVDKRSGPGRLQGGAAERLRVDDLDRKILTVLLQDSRKSYREVAGQLEVSPSTVMARVKRLEKERVVEGYHSALDYSRLGYELTVVTEIIVSKGRLLEMEREVARLPGVCAVYDITGETDGIAVAKFKDTESLSRFTKHILGLPFVERTNTHVVLATVKEDFRLPP